MRYLIGGLITAVLVTAGIAVAQDDSQRGWLRNQVEHYVSGGGSVQGDLTLENDETISNSTDDLVCLGGGGGTSDENICFDLDGTDIIDVLSTTGALSCDFGTVDLATDGLDLSEGDITNAGDVALDSITPDGSDISITISGGELGIGDGSYSWGHSPMVGIEGAVEIDGILYAESSIVLTNNEEITNTINGRIRFAGVDQTNNEAFSFDFETTANTIGVSSNTGVTTFDWGALNLTITGTVTAGAIAMTGDINVADYDILNPDVVYSEAEASDVAAADIRIKAANAYSQAAVNTTGGPLYLGGGVGTKKITCVQATAAGSTLTTVVDGTSTTVTLVAGAPGANEIQCITDDDTCCAAIETYYDANVAGFTATAVSDVVWLDPTYTTGDINLASADGTGTKFAVVNGAHGLIYVPVGVVSIPTISTPGDPNTGIRFPLGDKVRIIAGGSYRLQVGTTSVISTVPLNMGGRVYNSSAALNLGGTYAVTRGGGTGSVGIGKDAGGISLEVEGVSYFEDDIFVAGKLHTPHQFEDNFLYTGPLYGNALGAWDLTKVTGAGTNAIAAGSGRGGIATLTTGANADDFESTWIRDDWFSRAINSMLEVHAILVTDLADKEVRIGFGDTQTRLELGTDYVYFQYDESVDATNWYYGCSDAADATLGVGPTAGTAQALTIHLYSTGAAEFYVDHVLIATVAGCVNADTAMYLAFQIEAEDGGGGGAEILEVDHIDAQWD